MSYIPIDLASLLDSPVFTGDPRAPTPPIDDNDTSIATTAFVATAISRGATILVADAPPLEAPDNALWWESDTGVMYLRYNDGNTTQWVPITIGPQGPPGVDGDSGGSATVLVADAPPAGAPVNALWWESDTGVMYLRYNDGSSTQWVPITIGPQGPPGGGGGGGGGGATVLVADAPPAGAPDNSLWWKSDTGVMYLRYNDGNSTQWVPITIGPQGPAGPIGPTGPTGPAGGTGSAPPLVANAQAYTDLRRGLFIHYNMATFVGTDFVSSTTPVDTFAPTGLNIAQWIATAVNFGATYAHLTIKHKDGFCLWPTTTTTHGIANTTWYATHGSPDITQIFVNECRSRGILPCFYFSIADLNWIDTHPGYTNAQMKTFVEGQVTEVLGRYGPIAAVWLDSSEIYFGNQLPWASSAERAAFFHSVPNGTQTGLIIVNNAHTGSLADSDVVEYEETLPAVDANPKESCYSLVSSWFWQADTQGILDAGTMGDRITTCNARNATILVNVPPNTAGIMPAQFVARLNQINAYLGETPRNSPNNMTSNTAPSPYVASATTEYPGQQAYKAFNSALDSFWSSNSGALPVFIKIDLGTSKACSQYSVQTRKGGVVGQWLVWTLAGSNDNSSWTTAHTVTKTYVLPGQVDFYTMTTPGTYRYWRWTITSTNNGTDADVGNIALYT